MTVKLDSFIRNNYYFGKLLSVADFELEQAYYMNKLNLLSQLILEKGVIKGLDVKIHDTSLQKIVIEPGIGIDNSGRVIIVSEEITRGLSDIDGYDVDRDANEVVLSIKYHERAEGEAFALDRTTSKLKEKTYNQTVESFDLFLSTSETTCDENAISLVKIVVKQIGTDFEIIQVDPILKTELDQESSGNLEMIFEDDQPVISEEIDHGLGHGDVMITLSIVLNNNEDKCTYQGNRNLLKDLNITDVEYGVMTYTEKGTFTIIAKSESHKEESIIFTWHARNIFK